MKKVILLIGLLIGFVFVLMAGPASAQPPIPQPGEVWLVCDPAPVEENVTEVIYTLDGGQEISVEYGTHTWPDGEVLVPVKRLDTELDGQHDMTVMFRNVWGKSTAVPFAFRKSLPPSPSGIGLR